MIVSARLRRTALSLHVAASVGWMGAVVAFLGLAVAGVTSSDARTVTSAYIAMEILGWSILVPLAGCSFVTGVVQSLTTPWGLFRHYWVVVKLAITTVAA